MSEPTRRTTVVGMMIPLLSIGGSGSMPTIRPDYDEAIAQITAALLAYPRTDLHQTAETAKHAFLAIGGSQAAGLHDTAALTAVARIGALRGLAQLDMGLYADAQSTLRMAQAIASYVNDEPTTAHIIGTRALLALHSNLSTPALDLIRSGLEATAPVAGRPEAPFRARLWAISGRVHSALGTDAEAWEDLRHAEQLTYEAGSGYNTTSDPWGAPPLLTLVDAQIDVAAQLRDPEAAEAIFNDWAHWADNVSYGSTAVSLRSGLGLAQSQTSPRAGALLMEAAALLAMTYGKPSTGVITRARTFVTETSGTQAARHVTEVLREHRVLV